MSSVGWIWILMSTVCVSGPEYCCWFFLFVCLVFWLNQCFSAVRENFSVDLKSIKRNGTYKSKVSSGWMYCLHVCRVLRRERIRNRWPGPAECPQGPADRFPRAWRIPAHRSAPSLSGLCGSFRRVTAQPSRAASAGPPATLCTPDLNFPVTWLTTFWEGQNCTGFILGCLSHWQGSQLVHCLLKARYGVRVFGGGVGCCARGLIEDSCIPKCFSCLFATVKQMITNAPLLLWEACWYYQYSF